MPVHAIETRHQTIKSVLAKIIGEAPNARTVSAATLLILDQVIACLAPVLGAKGVDMLLRRAIHISGKDFPWMNSAVTAENGGTQLLGLGNGLDVCTADTASNASYTLLVNFTDLLATLIGERLTSQLLHPVWSVSQTEKIQDITSWAKK